MNREIHSWKTNVAGSCAFLPHPIYMLMENIPENMNVVLFCFITAINETHTKVDVKMYRDFWNTNMLVQHAGDKMIVAWVEEWLAGIVKN